jgi:hypothetical protein
LTFAETANPNAFEDVGTGLGAAAEETAAMRKTHSETQAFTRERRIEAPPEKKMKSR